MKLALGLGKIFSSFSQKISLLIFNQRLPLSYIFFNILYKKFIVSNKINDSDILKFHNSGFVKLNISLKDEILEYKDKFFTKKEDEIDKTKIVQFFLNDVDKKNFIVKVKKKLDPVVNKLEHYFNCDVFISDAYPFRIYHVEDQNNLEKENYANHFHQDGYLMIYNKIFVNLMDVKEKDGPIQIIPIENRNSFFKSFKYKNRNEYNVFGDQSLIYKNTGKMGECCLFSSPQVFHRAGVPENYRDILQLILVTIPKKYSDGIFIKDEVDLFKGNEKNIMKISKPFTLMALLKLFILFFQRKRK